MGKFSVFKIPPFLNAMTVDSIKSDPTDEKFYPFNTSYYVNPIQYNLARVFHGGSSVSTVLSSSNIKKVLKDQAREVNNSLEIAIVGRSNCGKSSLINALLGEKVAMPSKTPGKTQQLIFHTLSAKVPFPVSLVDFPGYGYAEAPIDEMNKWKEFAEWYLDHSTFLANTVLLVDCRRGIQESDRILLEILERSKRYSSLVLTKADSLSAAQLKDAMLKAAHETAKFPRTFGTIFATSAKLDYGIRELQMYLLFSLLNKLGEGPNLAAGNNRG